MKTNNKTKHLCKIATLVITLLLCINFAPTALAKAGSTTKDNVSSLSKAKAAKKNAIKLEGTKGKNKAEVAALKKILKNHNRENSPFLNLNNKKCYEWDKDGRLTRIGGGGEFTNRDNSLSYDGNLSLSAFPNLVMLCCGSGNIKELDISKNTALHTLYCDNNQLTSLDVSNCTSLFSLNCSDNQLTSLDVSNCTSLYALNCDGNQLTSLDVSNCTSLHSLLCHNNQLTSLDVSDCTPLAFLWCKNNRLTKLNLSKNTDLEYLYCQGNRLKKLNLSKNTALRDLDCQENRLTKLDLSKCKNLGFCLADDNVKIIGFIDPYR